MLRQIHIRDDLQLVNGVMQYDPHKHEYGCDSEHQPECEIIVFTALVHLMPSAFFISWHGKRLAGV